MTDAIESLRALVAMLPDLEADGAIFGEMASVEPDGDVISMPWFEFNAIGDRFHSLGHTVGAGLSMDAWEAWQSKEEAFLAEHSLIASASMDDLRRLVVTIVRAERFCDGAMQTALETGLVVAVLQRAGALV